MPWPRQQARVQPARAIARPFMRALALPLLALLAAGPAVSQEMIGTIARGEYRCELPGNAAGAAGIVQPEAGFVIESASRYRTAAGQGTYLRQGERMRFTSGPRNGEAWLIVNPAFLRLIGPDGQPGRLRCIRQSG